ncbi:MAG: amidohydrolase family protein [Streptosporangiales bacterium]|nr:amidohydrolase family protein [Streptosporangiales bacterium]
MLFGAGGDTTYRFLADALTGAPHAAAAVGAVAVLAGLAFKMGAVPSHFWVPDVTQGAPAPVAAYVTTIPKIGALVAAYRLVSEALAEASADWSLLVAVIAAASMTLGNLAAFWQDHPRRLLAYSTISQVGYLLMAVAVAGVSDLAQRGLLFYLAAYAVTNLGAFAVVIELPRAATLGDYAGLIRRHRWLGLSLIVCLLGFVGTPPTAIFVGKLVVYTAAAISVGLGVAGGPWAPADLRRDPCCGGAKRTKRPPQHRFRGGSGDHPYHRSSVPHSILETPDLLIRGGMVADGTGAPLVRGDVLCRGERVLAVEPPGAIPAQYDVRVLDADGLVVAPGFIDVHSHADNAPLLAEHDTTKILQGVTTEVVGNCGFSLAPAVTGRADELAELTARIFPELPWGWTGFADFLGHCDRVGYVTNYAPLVGHGTLRLAACGFADRPATADERARMGELLDEAMAAGAFGMSSGLIYPPGLFSDTDELTELAARLPADRVYATHMRDEGANLAGSIAEAIEVARRGGCRLQVSHLKAAGRTNWGKVPDALEALRSAREDGIPVTHDVYPYTASSTMLTALLPHWAHEGGNSALLARLRDPAELARLRGDLGGDLANPFGGTGPDGILVASTASHAFEGATLTEIAVDLGVDPFDALVEVLRSERLRASMVAFTMAEDDLVEALSDPYTAIGSDGLPPGVGGKPHPRLFGTFPRLLGHYCRDRGVLDLPTAVHRMTGLPARIFSLTDRGAIRPGAIADLVAFDADRVTSVCDYRDPVHPPEGIAWVVQAGETVVTDGRWLGPRRGRRLRPG